MNQQTDHGADARLAFEPLVMAFSVSCSGFAPGIYFAPNASKAKILALLQARDAGYKDMMFSDLHVKRAPEFDGATYCVETTKHGVVPDCLVLP